MGIHGAKLTALLSNLKLPQSDKKSIILAIEKYKNWYDNLLALSGSYENIIGESVKLLNIYKNYIDFNIIFLSKNDFLYRQKGQLKLDNTIIEEFLPLLVRKIFGEKLNDNNIIIGPTKCITGIRFDASITSQSSDGGMILKCKDQDFAISRPLFIKSSHTSSFAHSEIKETNITYLACECKINLDKTMFQEAVATAFDLKSTVPTSKYILICEWLDMTPISTKTTAIDEIIILRKARRIDESTRRGFSSAKIRKLKFNSYKNFINSNPIAISSIERFIMHVKQLLITNEEENIVLSK